MQSPTRSEQQIDIKEFYALNVKSLWQGLKQEHVSLWLLCTYFLFEYVRPQVLYPVIDILPWAFLFLVLAVVAAFNDKSASWVKNPLNKYFLLCMFVVLLSAIFAYFPMRSWEERNTMLTWLIVYFLVISVVNTERRLILFLLAYMLFNLKMGQHGVFGWASRGFSFAKYGLIGSPGWFRNSGEFSIQMLIFGSLAVSYVVAFRRYWAKYTRWFMIAAASTGYICVLGASSRGSQVALAGIIIWGVLKIRGGFKYLIVVAAIVVALYHILPEQQIERFQTAGDDNTSLQRLAYWKIGIELAKEHPVLGIGYQNWMPYVSRLYPEGVGPLQEVQVCHNIYIQAASELGYTGLAAFIIAILAAFWVNTRTRKMVKNSDYEYFIILSYGLDAGLIGFLIAGTFVTVLYYPFFWVQLTMIAMLNNVATKLVAQRNNAS